MFSQVLGMGRPELLERRRLRRRAAWSVVALLATGALTWKAITAPDGVADPTVQGANLARGAVVTNSALFVFREGLEAVLVLAAFTASFGGANRRLRRPVALGRHGTGNQLVRVQGVGSAPEKASGEWSVASSTPVF